MDEKQTSNKQKTAPVALNGPDAGNKSQNSMEAPLKDGSSKSSSVVTSKGSNKISPDSMASKADGKGAAGTSGATQGTGASMVTTSKPVTVNPAMSKVKSGDSNKSINPNSQATKQGRVLPSATKTSPAKSSSQTNASTKPPNSAPKIREFHVTHLSDNWKLRKAAKLAALEKERKAKAEASAAAAPSTTKDNESSESAPIPNTKSSLSTPSSVASQARADGLDLQNSKMEEDEENEQENRTPPSLKDNAIPANLFLPFDNLKENSALKLQQIESFLNGEQVIEGSSKKVLDSEDIPNGHGKTSRPFDIDLSLSESDTEDPSVSPKSKNKTLMAYLTACSKNGMTPNPTFMRQCGRSSIDMRNRMLTYQDAKPMAIALVSDRRTSVLDLSENPLGPQGTTCIAEMMYANESIMELNLSSTEPGSEGLSALAQTLPNNKHLRRLHLDNNKLQEGDGRHLAKIMTTVPDLRELNLNHTTLGFKDGTRLALALASDSSNLSHLSLQYNNIRTDSAVQLALSLGKNTTLKSLNLAWNGFGPEGCRALAKTLGENSSLTTLDLTNNRLGITSLEHLVEGLKKNTTLKSVKFGTNPMTTEGAKAIVAALGSVDDSAIEEIDLQGIPIDAEFLSLVENIRETRGVHVLHDSVVQMGTTNQTKEFDGDNLDRFDPVMVLFEYMKKDNLRVIDLFQFLDQKKRDKLSKGDLRDGVNILRLPFTEHALDVIMKALDKNRDGFIQLDEMVKGYKDNESIVKQRRIKANRRGKPDRGLEDLWTILKELIAKRKAENEKRSQAPALAKK
ncbi:leucine-rich repeat-containing protein 74b-like [Plakobranchus ocellatus]|uniref:Leucine-rich repeat-containing protein 74b-like n=1 Tax=Plakobranchus ocellatus TaxID=259542 RepID=A0AAV4BH99_9GAST|nr:leucine-rich repeat-containing protein 74b-like [Plakobranchus ocellatus]